jgi:hypothetical protein
VEPTVPTPLGRQVPSALAWSWVVVRVWVARASMPRP